MYNDKEVKELVSGVVEMIFKILWTGLKWGVIGHFVHKYW